MQQALRTVSQAVANLKARLTVSWVLDSGFDDVAVWRTIWEQQERVVCRVKHPERLVESRVGHDEWRGGDLEQAQRAAAADGHRPNDHGRPAGAPSVPEEQVVTVEMRACPVRLTYATNVRREGAGETRQKELWLVEVRLLGHEAGTLSAVHRLAGHR